MKRLPLALLLILISLTDSHSQIIYNNQSIDDVINATYDILSGEAGERDWESFKSLFHESAKMGATILGQDGKRTFYGFTVDQYILNNDAFLKKSDFYEEEIGRRVMRFGGVAMVYSAFQYKFSKDGKIEARGINCIQLVKEKGCWWITSLLWEDESINNKIPESLMHK
ncbi:hypothetical protein [Winogradskyella haliclonae]|uniref:Nuclear transport factor 2 family protein n=1 Tax=Winogradskyella haliclonae TaxID=2048558 RepID=A0ABQ2BW77_9FLAO|nr:hypothetical protein [Winogradskyella haliclonae]GGI56717.1 hypothetical protein GCM10011444_10260 [Winogradskyella haliclonae]